MSHRSVCLWIPLLTLIVVTACSEAPKPLATGPDVAATVQPGVDDLPPGIAPNGVPYRNPAYEHATGRSGEASLTGRALMNKDGSTDLEVTTGDFDGGDVSHEITKLQLKYMTPDGEVEWVRNENRLRVGYLTSRFDGLARHGNVQLQANVTGPNASGKRERTGVVTITERVNLRPDLAVTGVAGPERAYMNTTAMFNASISELNGDLGATANCIFYIDDEEVARSEGMWVAEGDMVGCAMSPFFTEPGTYTITAVVEEVNPGDYDPANNSASTTIEVVPYELAGSASASEDHREYDYNDFWRTDRRRRRSVRATFYGSAPRAVRFPVSLDIVQSSGRTVRHRVDLDGFGAAGPDPVTCTYHAAGGNTTELCSDTEKQRMWINVVRNTGMATYFARRRHRHETSWLHCHVWFGACFEWHRHYSFFYHDHWSNSSNSWGTGFTALGAGYGFDIDVVDADGTIFTTNRVVVRLDETYDYREGYTRFWGKRGSNTFGEVLP